MSQAYQSHPLHAVGGVEQVGAQHVGRLRARSRSRRGARCRRSHPVVDLGVPDRLAGRHAAVPEQLARLREQRHRLLRGPERRAVLVQRVQVQRDGVGVPPGRDPVDPGEREPLDALDLLGDPRREGGADHQRTLVDAPSTVFHAALGELRHLQRRAGPVVDDVRLVPDLVGRDAADAAPVGRAVLRHHRPDVVDPVRRCRPASTCCRRRRCVEVRRQAQHQRHLGTVRVRRVHQRVQPGEVVDAGLSLDVAPGHARVPEPDRAERHRGPAGRVGVVQRRRTACPRCTLGAAPARPAPA